MSNSNAIIISADAPTFPLSAAGLQERREKCLAMRVAGVADVEGFKVADRARMDVKADRCDVQNRVKDLKRQIKAWQDEHVDKPADHLCDELKKIETYLESQTEPVKVEKERIAREAKEKVERDAAAKLAGRIAELVICRAFASPVEVAAMSDTKFFEFLGDCQHANKLREQQEANEKAAREAERAELEELRKLKAASQVSQPQATLPPRSTNAIPSRPAIPIPIPLAADCAGDRQALLRFANIVDGMTVPGVSHFSDDCRRRIIGILKDTAVAIRMTVDDCLPEIDAMTFLTLTTSNAIQGKTMLDVEDTTQCAICGDEFANHKYVPDSMTQYRCPRPQQESEYGFFCGGDPRKFHPYFEFCDAKEVERHRQACELWDEAQERGETPEPENCPSGWEYDAEGKQIMHVLSGPYGIGIYTMEFETFFKAVEHDDEEEDEEDE